MNVMHACDQNKYSLQLELDKLRLFHCVNDAMCHTKNMQKVRKHHEFTLLQLILKNHNFQ